MTHGHGHGHGHGPRPRTVASASGQHVRPLVLALVISATLAVAELVVGLWTASLALQSDAAHLFTDVTGTGLAVAAIVLARRGRSAPGHTFGLYRAEVLAALANAVLLFGVAAYVLVEALRRLARPPEVPGLPVMAASGAAVVAGLVCFALLRSGADESINLRAAYLEVLADLLGAVGVLISGTVTTLFGWRYADPIAGVAIGLFVLPRTWALARHALRILFQHAPERLDVSSMGADLGRLPGVAEVHDLHVWTLTSGMEVLSAHLAVLPGTRQSGVLTAAQSLLAQRYHIEHATLQIESQHSARRCQELCW